MTNANYQGVVQNGTIVLRDAVPLPDGTEVIVTPVVERVRNGAAILAALEAAPKVPSEWVDELEQIIAEGRQPASYQDPFDDAKPEQR